MKTATQIPI